MKEYKILKDHKVLTDGFYCKDKKPWFSTKMKGGHAMIYLYKMYGSEYGSDYIHIPDFFNEYFGELED